LDIPGTGYKLWSDPGAPEIPAIYSQKEYKNFAEQEAKVELEEREAALALRERAVTLKEQELQFSEALDEIVRDGRITAAEKPSHLKRLKMLAAIPADNVAEFSEGQTNYSPTAEYLGELQAREKVVEFGEIAGDPPIEVITDPSAIAAGIATEMRAARERGEEISFAEASYRFQSKGGK
jgi:hypothetical protein